MASISESVIEEIKARIDLVDLISSYGVSVRRAGGSYKACCPFHHEKTPSFNIQPDRGFYHCFGCGKSGDAIRFVMDQEGFTFIEAVKHLARRVGVEIEEREDPQAGLRKRLYELHAELAAFYRRCLLRTKEGERARQYLAGRRISDDVAERFLIGYAPASAATMLEWARRYKFTADEMDAAGVVLKPRRPGEGGYHRFGGRLVFTIRDRSGRAVAFSCRTLETDKTKMRGGKYVNSPETPIFKKSSMLYALDVAAANISKAARREAMVCEGQIDVIRCHASGFPVAVAGQGSAFGAEQATLLKRVADSVMLVYDDDAAGHKAAVRTGRECLALEMPVRVATLPDGHDPDSMLLERGADEFRKCLDAAESLVSYQIRTMRAAESNPDSIDVVAKISHEVFVTLSRTGSAVMRAALMQEAARLMNLPMDALTEDFRRFLEKDRTRLSRSGPNASEKAPPKDPSDVPLEDPSAAEPATASASEAAPDGIEGEDAASPEVNPPDRLESDLCVFLFEHERERALTPLVDCLVPEALAHPYTRRFVEAWKNELSSAQDVLATLRGSLSGAEAKWFDAVVSSEKSTMIGERTCDAVFCDFLRQIWSAAVKRRIGELSAESTPENDDRRLRLQMLARTFKQGRWGNVVRLMTAQTLNSEQ